ncbi:MAG: DMT family transporter [Thermodesulfobacteriota bacterium]
MSERAHAALLLVLAAVLWSSGGLLIKLVDWSPLAIAGARSAVAGVFVWLVLRGRLCLDCSRPQLAAAVAYAAAVMSFVAATKLTTAANAILLQYTSPLYAALLAPRILGERTSGRDWAFIGLTLLGMGLFFFDQLSLAGLAGNLLALFSGLAVACLALALRQTGAASSTPIVLGNFLAALICLPFVVGAGWPGWQSLVVIAFLGVVQLGLPYYLYSLAVRRVSALEVTLIPVIEPILNPIWVALCLGETPGLGALAGGGLVLTAVTAWGLSRRQARVVVAGGGPSPSGRP